jgi:hypothetical protein
MKFERIQSKRVDFCNFHGQSIPHFLQILPVLQKELTLLQNWNDEISNKGMAGAFDGS